MDGRPPTTPGHAVDAVDDVLRLLLSRSNRLLAVAAGSVSLVDASGQRYSKRAEHGTSCQLGRSFPLDEGMTGRVVASRAPVVLDSYREIRAGHLATGQVARDGAVVAVPIWWCGDVVGANIAFAGRRRRFTTGEVDELEFLTQVAAPGIVRAAAADPALVPLLGQRDHPVPRGATDGTAPGSRPALTPRERQTLALLAAGLSNQQVATALVVSPKTVEKHVAAVLRKTGTSSRTGAVVCALERGWLRDRPPGAPTGRAATDGGIHPFSAGPDAGSTTEPTPGAPVASTPRSQRPCPSSP